MTASSIIAWALKDADAYGAHITALATAINSNRVCETVKVELRAKALEWNS